MPCPRSCARCLAGLCHGCELCQQLGGHRVGPRALEGRWVAFVGAREHGNLTQVDAELDALAPGTVVVSGKARGVDRHSARGARARGLSVVELEADWHRLGKRAGHLRNAEIVACADEVIAAPWWGCRGTLDTIDQTKQAGLPLRIVRPRSRLEVWTARMHGRLCDPDLLDITRGREQGEGRLDRNRLKHLVELVRTLRASGHSVRSAQTEALRRGAPSIGIPWAPSWELLGPALRARKRATTIEQEDALWTLYRDGAPGTPGFLDQLRASYREYDHAWGWLLAERRVVLGCFCRPQAWWPGGRAFDHCHRFVVAHALAACGATYRGELLCPT